MARCKILPGLRSAALHRTLADMPGDNPPPFQRLFIAIAVPSAVINEIGRAQASLQRHSPPGTVRWTPPDQFHITLKFLGDVPAAQVEAVKSSLLPVCALCPALRLSAHGIGFFPGSQAPRIIWIGARDANAQMPELHRAIDDALRWAAPAERPEKFTGHITLGRFKPGHHAAIPRLLELAAALHDRRFGDWEATEVELIRSELTSQRATHTVIATYPLAKRDDNRVTPD